MFGSLVVSTPVIFIVSVLKPVLPVAFDIMNSFATKPSAFFTGIVVVLASIILLPVTVVPFDTSSCPPTTFTLCFSNTAVLSVPLIDAFSNSASPEAFILHPLPALPGRLLDVKSEVFSSPDEFISKLFDYSWSLVNVHPAISLVEPN